MQQSSESFPGTHRGLALGDSAPSPNSSKRLGLNPSWEGSTCCCRHLLQPTTNTNSSSSCKIWVPSKKGHTANLATRFRPKQTKEARALLPFKPAILSRSIHRSSGMIGKKRLFWLFPPSSVAISLLPRQVSEPDSLHVTLQKALERRLWWFCDVPRAAEEGDGFSLNTGSWTWLTHSFTSTLHPPSSMAACRPYYF